MLLSAELRQLKVRVFGNESSFVGNSNLFFEKELL
jgi:hypothetical protein